MPPIQRPIGFGSLWKTASPAPTAGAGKPADAAPAPATNTGDRLVTRSLRNERFRADAQLAGVAAGAATLATGATGESVKRVQQALVDMAFVIPFGATGSYGAQTVQAVKNFQSFAGIEPTGTVDAETLRALDKFAPAAGKKSWDEGQQRGPIPSPELGRGKKARVVVDISQHRAFLFDKSGQLTKIYGVRTGRGTPGWGATKPGVKVVDGKNNDPRAVSRALWPESGGKAFGTRLLNLSDYDVATGRKFFGAYKGQELHGTYQDFSIGQNYSHGCVGLTNADIEEIFDQIGNGELVKFEA